MKKSQEANKCTHSSAWHNGECCCNCKFQLKLTKHPWNKSRRLKGSITEESGLYACSVFIEGGKSRTAIISERKHGYCEAYHKIENITTIEYQE